MPSNLVVRSKRPAPLLTRELRKSQKLSLADHVRIRPNLFLALFGALFLTAAIYVECVTHINSVLLALGMGFGGVNIAIALFWAVQMDEDVNVKDWSTRRQQLDWSKAVKHRAHGELESTRLEDVDNYCRYTPTVVRNGDALDIKMIKALPSDEHLLPWKCSVERVTVDTRGSFSSSAVHSSRIENPTVDKVMEKLDEFQQIAEALEQRSYESAMSNHKLDVMAIAMSPPIASAKTRARVGRDDWIAELKELDA